MTETDLTIPDFLRGNPAAKARRPRTVRPPKITMPKSARTSRSAKRRQKESDQNLVLDQVRSGNDTFGKLRKALGDDVPDNRISSALKALKKQRKISQTGRRYQ